MTTDDDRESLKERLSKFSAYGPKFDRALDTVVAGGVKECRFNPSGRKVLTVVGRYGDEFVDPAKPYCSCSNFFFRVARGREELCYHLLAYKMAVHMGNVDIVQFSDDEYPTYLTAAVRDVFEVLGRSNR